VSKGPKWGGGGGGVVGLVIVEVSRSHSDTPHSVVLLWTRDHLEFSLPDNTQHSQETGIHVPGGIRTRNPSRRAAAGMGENGDNIIKLLV